VRLRERPGSKTSPRRVCSAVQLSFPLILTCFIELISTGIFLGILPQFCEDGICPADFLFTNSPEYSGQSHSARHNFTYAVRSTDLVGRAVKSTAPAISPIHEMAVKVSGKGSIYFFWLPIHGRSKTRTTKETGSHGEQTKQTNGA
jgi:hypothetical protein